MNQTSKLKPVLKFSVALLAMIFFGRFVAYGGWNPDTAIPPTLNPAEPIHIGAGQDKSAGLRLNWDVNNNASGNAASGLIVFGDAPDNSRPGTGRVGIGTTNPTEKLDVNGNFQIDQGLLKIKGIAGPIGSILRASGASMIWSSPVSWVTFTGGYQPGGNCDNISWPEECSAKNLKTYLWHACLTDADNNYSMVANVCYQ